MNIQFPSMTTIQNIIPTSTPQATSADFSMYLADAFKTQRPEETNASSELFNILSNSSQTSVLKGLLTNDTNNSNIMAALNAQQTNGFATNEPTNGLNMTGAFSTYLQSTFESNILKSLTTAKTKLQQNLQAYTNKYTNDATEATKLRAKQMETNIQFVEQLIASKTPSNTTSTVDPLALLTNTNISPNVFNTGNKNAALAQYTRNSITK